MLSYGFGFIPLNFLFLTLGILLVYYAGAKGIALPEKTDSILPYLASNHLGSWVLICFTLGITAASFSNADSALTSLTTSVCTDLLGMDMKGGKSEKDLRHWINLGICIAFALMVLIIGSLQQTSLLKTIYTAVSYTYGPLLGFFAFGLITKYPIRDCFTPYIALASPLVSYLLAYMLELTLGYKVGYEILLFNGLFTFSALWLIRQRDGEKVFV